MDIEKLIERLRSHRGALFEMLYKQDMDDAATALSVLQAENEKLRVELEQVRTDCAVAEKNHADCIDELEQVKREFDGICEYIDSEGFLRKQFCENGNPDLEPCICPSLQQHQGYIDSDDCEGCDHFCNSWRGQKED